MNEMTESARYALNNRQENIKNGYELQVKSRTIGVISILLFGPFGYLYYGLREFWDKFKMLFFVIIVAGWAAFTKNGLIDVFAWITVVIYCIDVYLSPFFRDELHYVLTEEGAIAKSSIESEAKHKSAEVKDTAE